MASTSTQTPRRIPGAPPVIFLEGGTVVDVAELASPDISTPKTKIREKKGPEEVKVQTFSSMYGEDEIPVFGRPFGMPVSPQQQQRGESSAMGALMGPEQPPKRKKPSKSLNPYEELLMEADSDLDKYVGGNVGAPRTFSPSIYAQQPSPSPSLSTPALNMRPRYVFFFSSANQNR